MTSTAEEAGPYGADSGWLVASEPAVAAPLRAVDVWRCRRDGDELAITARVGVRGDEPNLRGHFPGLAVYPGIFVIETLCQAIAQALLPDSAAQPPQLRSIRSVRFLAPLLDGDELTLEITGSRRPDGGWDVQATGSRADGTTSARISAEFDEPGSAAEAPQPDAAAPDVRGPDLPGTADA